VKFTRETILGQGVGNLLKKAVSGEGARLTKAEGNGVVYLADAGKKVTILELENESIIVNANDILAFQNEIKYDIKMMKKVAAMLQGGLFNIRLEGTGLIALTTHYDPLTLVVTPDRPILTDPNATIAWSGGLEPKFKKDISVKTFFGRSKWNFQEKDLLLFSLTRKSTCKLLKRLSIQAASDLGHPHLGHQLA